jgi:hypothetical protein
LFVVISVCRLHPCVLKEVIKVVSKMSKTLVKWGSVYSQQHQVLISQSTRNKKLKINLYLSYHHLAILDPCLTSYKSRIKEACMKTWRWVLSFSLVSSNLGTRFLLSGVVCHTPKFLIFGCAYKTLNKINGLNICIKLV